MPKKSKEYNPLPKIRSALRQIWRYSPMHREAIKCVVKDGNFECAICHNTFPKELAAVDHEPPLGAFNSFKEMTGWAYNLFYGPVQVVCKHLCHKKKTAEQRRKAK
jgi:hypothetical protein